MLKKFALWYLDRHLWQKLLLVCQRSSEFIVAKHFANSSSGLCRRLSHVYG